MAALFIEAIGWAGAFLILAAYIMLTRKTLTGQSRLYHLLNLVGGIGIVIESISNATYPPAALNIVWSLVAVYAILKGLSPSKEKKTSSLGV